VGGSSEPTRHLVLGGRLPVDATAVTLGIDHQRAEADVEAGLWLGVVPWNGLAVTVTIRFTDRVGETLSEDHQYLPGIF
jgi:hypothetical protein